MEWEIEEKDGRAEGQSSMEIRRREREGERESTLWEKKKRRMREGGGAKRGTVVHGEGEKEGCSIETVKREE